LSRRFECSAYFVLRYVVGGTIGYAVRNT